MKRLFAALKITPDAEFVSSYRLLQTAMRYQQIKWVEEHNIHITLKFFGDTEERKIPQIASVLSERASGTAPFTFRLSKLGIFGSRYAPRVIWTGIEPHGPMAALMKEVQEDLRKVGYEPDRQNLVPHLTLGRVKEIRDRELFARAMDQFREMESQPMESREIILYESILRREGPEYRVIGKYAMAPAV